MSFNIPATITVPCAVLASFSSYANIEAFNATKDSKYFNESCIITPFTIEQKQYDKCNDYLLVDQSSLSEIDRVSFSKKFTSLGLRSPYLLVLKPKDRNNELISTFESLDSEILVPQIDSYLDQVNYPDASYLTRSRRSIQPMSLSDRSTSTQGIYKKRIRHNIPFTKTAGYNGSDRAFIDYELEFFAKHPFDADLASDPEQNRKYVRVTVNGGSIQFNAHHNRRSEEIISYWREQTGQANRVDYVYNDYLDKAKIATSITGGDVFIEEYFPRYKDRNQQRAEYNSHFDFGFSLNIPKSPIKSIQLSSSKSIVYSDGNEFDFTIDESQNRFSVEYSNKRYGSQISTADGYCQLFPDAGDKGKCWHEYHRDYGSQGDYWDTLFDLSPLQKTSYSNGFLPTYSVIYHAPGNKQNDSTLTLNTSIQGMAIRAHAREAWHQNGNAYVAGDGWNHKSKGDGKNYGLNRYNNASSITIDWQSPLFDSAQPVTVTPIFGSDTSARCMTVKSNNSVQFENCNEQDINQLFYYTAQDTYVTVKDKSLCLDSSSNVLTVKRCSRYAPTSQRWYWSDNRMLHTTQSLTSKLIDGSVENGTDISVVERNTDDISTEYMFIDSQAYFLNTLYSQQ
ncbi:TPA: ricin-type beta-trefoil lectin domain protein [Vibrio parahaemolyticus]